MNMNFNFNNPTNLIFGAGKLKELGNQKLPGRKALLLISSGNSVKTYGILDRVQEQLKKANAEYVICGNIHKNSSKELVMEAAAVARENACDFIVALGGGAVLDSAVAVSAMATNPGLPIVTIATSSGTGSEINCWGVISNHQTNKKLALAIQNSCLYWRLWSLN